ncbi:MAG: YciI-like protein [Gammaproteobacteria bacterium]
MYSLLQYDYVHDIVERRAPFRDAQLALAREAHERGALLMAGALAEPIDGAVLVFATDDRSIVEDFVARDPYVREGLVTSWRIRPWNVVIGS